MNITRFKMELKDGSVIYIGSPAEQEASRLLKFLQQLHHESSENLNREADGWDNASGEDSEPFIKDCNESSDKLFIAAFNEKGKIIATLSLFSEGRKSSHCSELGMGVLKEWQRKGLGTQLITTAEKYSKAIGTEIINLKVRSFNKAAIALYEKNGFFKVGSLRSVVKIEDNYYDEYLYQKILEHSPQFTKDFN